MPSIQDVADQINAKLDQVSQNTADTVAVGNGIRNDLAGVHAKLEILDVDLRAGVSEISNGLFAIWELEKVTNSILNHHSAQNDSIICLLENTTDLLCGITRKLTRQLELSDRVAASLNRVEGIAERAEPAAAADFDRLANLHHELRECCPPAEAAPERCPESCPEPKAKPYRPAGQDWTPSPPEQVG